MTTSTRIAIILSLTMIPRIASADEVLLAPGHQMRLSSAVAIVRFEHAAPPRKSVRAAVLTVLRGHLPNTIDVVAPWIQWEGALTTWTRVRKGMVAVVLLDQAADGHSFRVDRENEGIFPIHRGDARLAVSTVRGLLAWNDLTRSGRIHLVAKALRHGGGLALLGARTLICGERAGSLDLRNVGTPSNEIVEALIAASREPQDFVRRAAILGLGQAAIRRSDVVPWLADVVVHPESPLDARWAAEWLITPLGAPPRVQLADKRPASVLAAAKQWWATVGSKDPRFKRFEPTHLPGHPTKGDGAP